MGTINDIDLAQLFDETKSIKDGALTIPGYTVDGWGVRIITESGFVPGDKPIKDFTAEERHAFLYQEATKVKLNNMNLTYLGLIPNVQKSFLSKDVDARQPHIRAFVERAVTFQPCPECGGTRLNEGARSSKIDGKSIADVCAMQISDLAEWMQRLDLPGAGPLFASLVHLFDSFVDI